MKNINIQGVNEEDIIYSGPANHVKGRESVGGKLYLTNNELIFMSHSMNVQTHTYRIDIQQIKDFQCPFFPPTALRYTDNAGKVEKFIVYKRKTLISKIEAAQAKIN